MPQDWSLGGSRDRVQVRLHDAGDPADACKTSELRCAAAMAAAEVAQGLDGHVDADLVAVLEAVGDGLRG